MAKSAVQALGAVGALFLVALGSVYLVFLRLKSNFEAQQSDTTTPLVLPSSLTLDALQQGEEALRFVFDTQKALATLCFCGVYFIKQVCVREGARQFDL